MKFRVTYKRFAATAVTGADVTKGAMVLVDDVIEAASYEITEVGALTFFVKPPAETPHDNWQPVMTIPPGLWLLVEQLEEEGSKLVV